MFSDTLIIMIDVSLAELSPFYFILSYLPYNIMKINMNVLHVYIFRMCFGKQLLCVL